MAESIQALDSESRRFYSAGQRSFDSIAEESRQARRDLEAAIESIRLQHSDFLSGGLAISDFALLVASKGRAIVYMASTDQSSFALIVYRGTAQEIRLSTIWMPGLTEACLKQKLFGFSHSDSEIQIDRIAESYFFSRFANPSRLEPFLKWLGELLMEPLASRLRRLKIVSVNLIPCGDLSLMPLHAASYRNKGRATRFLKEFEVSYAPSALALRHSVSRLQERESARCKSLLAVANPLPTAERMTPLLYAEAEAESIRAHFPQRHCVLIGNQAVCEAVRAKLWGCEYLHFACHGEMGSVRSWNSSLILARGERLTVADLLDSGENANRLRTRLAVLSACSTADIEITLPDEAIGLPAAFLQAGVPGVIATLWRVEDMSTALLTSYFYACHLKGGVNGQEPQPPAAALRQAQLWLCDATADELIESCRPSRSKTPGNRPPQLLFGQAASEGIMHLASHDPDSKPFADPYYWAPFIFLGV